MVIVLLFLVACGGVFGYVILQPLIRASQGRRCPTRFFMSDLIWLTLMLQFPLAFLSVASKWHGMKGALVPGLILVAVCVYAWLRSATALSGLGINGPLRRGLFLVIVLPMATFGAAVAGVGIPIGIPIGLMAMAEGEVVVHCEVAAIALVAMVALCFACRRLTTWVVADPARNTDVTVMEKLPE